MRYRRLSVVALGVLIAGCNSSHNSSANGTIAATSSPGVNYSKQYEADAGPVNALTTQFSKTYANATSITAAQTKPLVDYLVTYGRELLSQSWPASAVADIHALASADELMAADLSGGISYANLATFTADANKANADAQVVRADLGLPPVQS